MRISGTIELPTELAPNLDKVSVTPISFSFEDGVQVLDETSALHAGFNFSTDASGAITEWQIGVSWETAPAPGAIFQYISTVNQKWGTDTWVIDGGRRMTCLSDMCDPSINDFGQVADNPGSWTVVSNLSAFIDIKPGSDVNPINPKSKGKCTVAILTTEDFDASMVDVSTIQFGEGQAPPVHYALEDVDSDTDWDLVLQFKTQDTAIACGDTEATLTGKTLDGESFTGTDSIKTVGCK